MANLRERLGTPSARSCCSCSEKASFCWYAGRLYRATSVSILRCVCSWLCGYRRNRRGFRWYFAGWGRRWRGWRLALDGDDGLKLELAGGLELKAASDARVPPSPALGPELPRAHSGLGAGSLFGLSLDGLTGSYGAATGQSHRTRRKDCVINPGKPPPP